MRNSLLLRYGNRDRFLSTVTRTVPFEAHLTVNAQLSARERIADSMSLWKEQVNEIIESASPDRKSVFIGMGHPLRTDDNCGSYIIQKIIGRSRRETSDSVVFLDGEDNVENLITKVADLKPRHVVFVDACEMKESPGTTRLIPVSRTTFPFFTTHGVPLKLLAQQVLPESEVSILAIQPKNTDFGEKLSTEIRGVADLISDFVSELLRGREWQIGS